MSRYLWLKTACAPLAVLGSALALLSCTAPTPVIEPGTIRPCPVTPNCVSSLARENEARIPPLAEAQQQIPWSAVRSAVTDSGGTIVLERDGYLWATFTSRLFRFIDDLEIRREPDGSLQVRSASRSGTYDFGVNGHRVLQLRTRLHTGSRCNSHDQSSPDPRLPERPALPPADCG